MKGTPFFGTRINKNGHYNQDVQDRLEELKMIDEYKNKIKDEIAQILNQARVLEKRTVGNIEFANRIYDYLASRNLIRGAIRDDMVLVRKVDIAKAMLSVATSDVIEDTVWLDEFITLYEHLATIGKICDENYNDIDYLKAMIKAYEEGNDENF